MCVVSLIGVFKIQYIRPMGNCISFLLKVGLALCIGMILHQTIVAQCSNGFSTHTYDTTLASSGLDRKSVV